MVIAITEINAWEQEKWVYVLDVSKQDSEALNHLMIFMRIANEHFDRMKAQEEKKPTPLPYHPLFNRNPVHLFAASSYRFKFYKDLDMSGRSPRLVGTREGTGLILSNRSGYNSNSYDLDMVISPRKMQSVMRKMRDKGENDIYKCFDSLFLKKKHKTLTTND